MVIEVKMANLVSQLLMHLQLGVESDSPPENYSHNENRHKNRRLFSFLHFDLNVDLLKNSTSIHLTQFCDRRSEIQRWYGIGYYNHWLKG